MSSHGIPELPADIQGLFEEEKALVPLPGAARARVALRLAEGASLSSWSARALRLMRKSGWVTVVFLAGAGVGAGLQHERDAAVQARSVASPEPHGIPSTGPIPSGASERPLPDSPNAAVQAPKAESATAPEATSHAMTSPPRAAPARAPSSLAEERAMLETARAAMTRGRWSEAAAALDRHAASFPKGQLAEERASLDVLLLAERGHVAETRAAKARFERRYPASLFLPAVRAAADSMTDASDAGQVLGEPKGR
jgi:hypothetical protein